MNKFLASWMIWAGSALAVPAMDLALVQTSLFSLATGQAITGQLVVVADQVELSGSAHDDVFVLAGRRIDLTGENLGDTWVLSESAHLGGRMVDHVRALGKTLQLQGVAEHSYMALGSSVLLATGSVVRGDVAVAGETVTLEGSVGGDAFIMAQSVTLAGSIAGRTRIFAQDIVVMPGTQLGGDLEYASPKEVFLDDRIQLGGTLRRLPARAAAPAISLESLAFQFMQMVGALVAGLLLAGLFPRVTGRAALLTRWNPVRCLLSGLASLVLIPLLVLAAVLTVLGLPAGLLAGGLAAALLYLGKVVVALGIGGAILRRHGPPSFGRLAGAMAIGLLVLYSLFALPVVGGSLVMLVAIGGSGALWWAILHHETRQPAVPPPVPGGDGQQP